METSTSALVRAYGSSLRAEPATILVAENHDSVRMVVRETLESRGYNVLLGRDGSEAIRHIATQTGSISC